jgi:hypothetical protein
MWHFLCLASLTFVAASVEDRKKNSCCRQKILGVISKELSHENTGYTRAQQRIIQDEGGGGGRGVEGGEGRGGEGRGGE